MNLRSQPNSDFIVDMYTLDNTDGDFSVGGNVGQNRPFVRSGIPNVTLAPTSRHLGEICQDK